MRLFSGVAVGLGSSCSVRMRLRPGSVYNMVRDPAPPWMTTKHATSYVGNSIAVPHGFPSTSGLQVSTLVKYTCLMCIGRTVYTRWMDIRKYIWDVYVFYSFILYYIELNHIIFYHIISCHIMLYFTMLYVILLILYCILLYYVLLYYIILCYIIL